MESYLKRYTFEIKTLSPVFIGGGVVSGKKEYLYDRDKNEIIFFDLRKMYSGLMKLKKLDAFEEYMLYDRRDLSSFFYYHHISEKQYKPWIDYQIPVGDRNMVTRSSSDVLRFIKDGHGMPYMPGSSLKGALRTILMSDYYLHHSKAAEETANDVRREPKGNRNTYMAGVNRHMANQVLHKQITEETKLEDMQNDVLRGLIVSDSDPIDKNALCVCQKIEHTVDGETKRLNLLRECLKPGVSVRFSVTLDTSICPFTTLQIAEAVTGWFKHYHAEFSSKFRNAPVIPVSENKNRFFFLGGGAGYATKTLTYALMQGEDAHREIGKIINNTLPDKQKREHNHESDYRKGVSPHILKCTIFEGKSYQMGACWMKSIKRTD